MITREPSVVLLVVVFATAVMLAGTVWRRKRTWMTLAGANIGLLAILSYGYANVSVPGSIPLPDVLLMLALLLGALQAPLRELDELIYRPAAIGWMLILVVGMGHLVIDVPTYGVWAVRDASVIVEASAVVLGFLWARSDNRLTTLLRWLPWLFVVNAVYALLYPLEPWLKQVSPVSGVFRPTPIVGYHTGTSLILISGLFYFAVVAPRLNKWPHWSRVLMAVLQSTALLMFQERGAYIALLIAVVGLVMLGQQRLGLRVAISVALTVALLGSLVGMTGLSLPGRVGRVSLEMFAAQASSLMLEEGAPGTGSAKDRLEWTRLGLQRWAESPSSVTFGVGYGTALTPVNSPEGAIREPHNSHLSLLIRLGLLGLLGWVVLNTAFVSGIVKDIREGTATGSWSSPVSTWILATYLAAVVRMTFQPWLEFSFGAMVFFFIVGLGVGMGGQKRTSRQRSVRPSQEADLA